MNKFQTASPTDTSSNPSSSQFNVLNARDYFKQVQELSHKKDLWDFIEKSFQMKFDTTRGLRSDELEELIGSDHGSDGKFVLEEIQKLSNRQSTCFVAAPSTDPKVSETKVIFGQKINDKYDVLDIQVKQTTEIDYQKLASVVVGAACVGVMVSVIGVPVVGAIATGTILTGAGIKTAYDSQKTDLDCLYAYVFKQLNDKNVLRFENGSPFF